MSSQQDVLDTQAELAEGSPARSPESERGSPANNNKHRRSSEPVESQGESQQSDLSVDQELGCGICLDTLTTPYTITPCLHTFDKSCLIEWWKKSNNCPTCKKKSTSAKFAFQLDAIINHVHKNRQKRRKLSKDTRKDEIYPSCGSSSSSTASSDLDSQETQGIPPGGGLVWPCIACVPGNPTGYTCPTPIPEPTREDIEAIEIRHPDWAPITAPSRGDIRTPLDPAIETGVPGANEHSLCTGCETYVPLGFPQAIRCGGCANVFCHNLEPAGCPSSRFTFVPRNDAKLMPHDISTLKHFFPYFIKNNQHEMTRFTTYITARNLLLTDILVALFEAKRNQSTADMNADTADERWDADSWVCNRCVYSVANSMFFEWWMNERRSSLERQDGILPSKPDCWYGRECRTQMHNDSHAERLNHLCENTRAPQ